MGKLTIAYIHGHNILRLFDTFPNFLFPQVKRDLIISNQHGIYQLPHELPNDLRLRIIVNLIPTLERTILIEQTRGIPTALYIQIFS